MDELHDIIKALRMETHDYIRFLVSKNLIKEFEEWKRSDKGDEE